MASNTRVVELASIIQSSTETLNTYLGSQGIGSPSFEIDAPDISSLPPEIAKARETILDATNELHNLALGPTQVLTAYPCNSLISLQAIEKFNIATSFPVGSEASFADIAQKCGLTEADTKKILRQAMTQHVFKEPRKGFVAHTAISKQIAENPLMRDWISFMCTEMWGSAPRAVDAMAKWPGSEEPAHTGWVLANNSTAPLVEEILKLPERFRRVPDAMQMAESGDGLQPEYMIKALDWSGVRTFVDVVGANGSAKAPEDVSSRIEYMAHDFNTPQPVKGADIYFFRWIFHDWSDKYVIKVLRALIPALKKGARIVANDKLLPEPGGLSPYQEQALRNFDLYMKQMNNGKERDADDWAALFKAADLGFKLQSIRVPPGAKLAVIEAVWDGESHA